LEVWPFVARAEISSLYAEHEIFVLPSLMEGMPLVLLEAMASGMPVVTTEIKAEWTDLVEDLHDGVFCISGRFGVALSRDCQAFAAIPSCGLRLGSAARKR